LQVHIVVGSEYSFWPWALAVHLLSVLQEHIVVGSECLLEKMSVLQVDIIVCSEY
jgi:hypothetical protein